MNDDATRRVILVTGAGKGIGRAIAERLARNQARVVVNNRVRDGDDPAATAVAAIVAQDGEAVADIHDITAPDAAEEMVRCAIETWGRLDGVVLNAGVAGPAQRFPATSEQTFRDVFETNFFANVRLAHAAMPHLMQAQAGRLLAIASSAGLYGVFGRSPYAASKGALVAWTLSLAQEAARERLRVNVLAPYAATQMTHDAMKPNPALMQRLTPERTAPMAAWLMSPSCTATGQIWIAGGGALRRASMMEAPGERAPDVGAEAWIGMNAARLQDMRGAKDFAGAEAAFADFLSI